MATLAAGDDATWTQTFDDDNAGTGKTLTPDGAVNDGNDGDNYDVTFINDTTGVIDQREITVTAVTDTKVYDGDNTSDGAPTITDGTLAAGDDATWTQTFDDENAGTDKTLTPDGEVNDGNDGDNYDVTFINDTTGEITALDLTVASVTAANKVYDATVDATITGGTLNGVLGSDNVSLNISGATGIFASLNIGSAIPVGVSGLALAGTDAGNYDLPEPSGATFADITARPITVMADAKTKYVGDSDPSLTYQITSGSVAGGDVFTGFLTREAGETAGNYAIQQGTLAIGAPSI